MNPDPMRTLICGSLAYDNIMVFRGRFREHILPEQIHILNVAFLVPELRREFGGCAGNIAYNLRLLGSDPLVMGTVGDDSLLYFERLERLGIKPDFVRQVPNTLTAQAFITTDLDDNQITAFHPGAMSYSHLNNITKELDVHLAIIAPDGREGMLQHARELAELDIPFMFDPGQGLPMFSGEELRAFVERAAYVAVNDYEVRLLEERTGRKLEEMAHKLKALVLTRGAEGSIIYTNGQRIETRCVDGLDQDRVAWRPEPFHEPRRNQAPVPPKFRVGHLRTRAGLYRQPVRMPPGFHGGSYDRWRPTALRSRCACSDWQGSRFIWCEASLSRGCATRNFPRQKSKRKSAVGRERCSLSSPCPCTKRTHRKSSPVAACWCSITSRG